MLADRIHQNPIALLKSGSFRPFVCFDVEAGHGNTVVFKTNALNHSAILHGAKSTTYKRNTRYVVDCTPVVYRNARGASTQGLIQEAFREDV